jgi:CRP-like cAMP-binding protein
MRDGGAPQLLHTERLVMLRRFPTFASMEPALVGVLTAQARERFYPAGTVIYREGTPVTRPLWILEGRVSISRHGHQLREAGPLSHVGHIVALAASESGIRAVAEEDTFGLEIDIARFLDICEENFPLLRATLRDIAGETIRLRRMMGVTGGFPAPTDQGDDLPAELDLVDRIFYMRRVMVVAGNRLEALADLARDAVNVHLPLGATLWEEGDRSSHLYMLLSGRIDCTNSLGQSFALAGGDLAGGVDANAALPRWYRAVAATDVTALRMEHETFLDVLEDNTEIGLNLLRVFATAVPRLYERVTGAGA